MILNFQKSCVNGSKTVFLADFLDNRSYLQLKFTWNGVLHMAGKPNRPSNFQNFRAIRNYGAIKTQNPRKCNEIRRRWGKNKELWPKYLPRQIFPKTRYILTGTSFFIPRSEEEGYFCPPPLPWEIRSKSEWEPS